MSKIFVFLLLFGCHNVDAILLEEIETLEINPRLIEDQNGLYHLKLINKQTIHRVEAELSSLNTERVIWDSNKKWFYIDQFGNQFEIPIVNSASYSKDGIANTVLAPIFQMKGDTVSLSVKWNNLTDSILIVLE